MENILSKIDFHRDIDDGSVFGEFGWAETARYTAYLPGSGDTLISKEVPPGRGLSIALRLG